MPNLIKLLHPRNWDTQKGRFQSLVFRPSDDGGISVFCEVCATNTSGCVCVHAKKFYQSVTNDPPIYWMFDSGILPKNCLIVETPSTTGDLCHRDIINISRKSSEKFFKYHFRSNCLDMDKLTICSSQGVRSLVESDIPT